MSSNARKLRDRPYRDGRRESQPGRRLGSKSTDLRLTVSPASDEAPNCHEVIEPQSSDLGQGGWASEAVSSCGAGEGRDTETSRSSQFRCSDCAALVHELSNRMTTVLMNAQLLEWRLPPYSRLKRPVLEVERNAQRGGELLKQLRRQLGRSATQPETAAEQFLRADPRTGATALDPSVSRAEIANLQQHFSPATADFSPEPAELTVNCDPCTSSFFPKGDDGNES